MAGVLLSLHVLGAIIFIGPVTVAVSLFPRYARAAADPTERIRALPVLALLHRISTVYAVLGLAVPVFGIAVALQLEVLTDAWLLTSMVLTVAAAVLLAAVVLPTQRQMMAAATAEPPALAPDWRRRTVRLASVSGVFALLWAVVTVLMISRPGSTTGV